MNTNLLSKPELFIITILVYLSPVVYVSAQLSPFAVIKDSDGFTNVRYGKSKKIAGQLYNDQVFAISNFVDVDGWKEWYWIVYPDYALAKKPFEKFINKTKEGMIHKSRLIALPDLPQWKKQVLKDDTMVCKNGFDKLTLRYGKFIKSNHTYTKNGDAIVKIDGSEPWGIDGDVSDQTIEIKSITLETNNQKYEFPREAIKNMLMPTKILSNFGVAQGTGQTLFLYMSNSDAAGSYDVVWTIKSGKVVSQFLYRNF
jgi:hypothetical protein